MNRSIILLILIIIFLVTNYNLKLKKIATRISKPPSNSVYVIQNFLNNKTFNKVKNIIENDYSKNYNKYYRSSNFKRSGAAISHLEYNKNLLNAFQLIKNNITLANIKKGTNLDLQFVEGTDPNQISLLIYDKENDGIDWHYDNSEYYGNRWSAILIISNKGYNKKYSNSEFIYKNNNNDIIRIKNKENDLILFQGDVVKHKVSKILKGEKRIVISMVLCDVCTRKHDLISLIKQKFFNFIFYG